MNYCPWCGCPAVDISTHCDGDRSERTQYICIGPETHRFRDGDVPDEQPSEPLIILARD